MPEHVSPRGMQRATFGHMVKTDIDPVIDYLSETLIQLVQTAGIAPPTGQNTSAERCQSVNAGAQILYVGGIGDGMDLRTCHHRADQRMAGRKQHGRLPSHSNGAPCPRSAVTQRRSALFHASSEPRRGPSAQFHETDHPHNSDLK